MFDSAATYVEEKSGQHLDLAEGVSSLFPRQSVRVKTHACYIPHSEESASQHIPIPSIIFTGAAFKPQDREHHSQTQTFVEPGLLGLG